MTSESEDEFQCTPPSIREMAENVTASLLPSKSKGSYKSAYKTYLEWKQFKRTNLSSESILLAFFDEMAKKYKSTTLWTLYSKLKATININEKVDISNYNTLTAFMKKKSRGFSSKKSNVFTPDQMQSFLTQASDEKYLTTKVSKFVLILKNLLRNIWCIKRRRIDKSRSTSYQRTRQFTSSRNSRN